MKKENRPAGSALLKTAFLSGLMLLVIFAGLLALVHYAYGGFGSSAFARGSGFHALLQEYDFRYSQLLQAGGISSGYQQLDSLSRDLDYLETRAEVVENWLSILKRRRQLAENPGSAYYDSYRQAAVRAMQEFPFSEPISAVAAAALIHETAITAETETRLRQILRNLAGQRFIPMRLSLHVLLGDFENPQRAAENLLDGSLPLDLAMENAGQENDSLLTALAILKVMEGDTRQAVLLIDKVLASMPLPPSQEDWPSLEGPPSKEAVAEVAIELPQVLPGTKEPQTPIEPPSPQFVRFAAEFFYDFGDPLRSADLFNMLPGDQALARQADALWIGGDRELAKNIWRLLAAPSSDNETSTGTLATTETSLTSMALYNLLATATNQDEIEEMFGQLAFRGSYGDVHREMGFVRYSRRLEAGEAVALLQNEQLGLGESIVSGLPVSAIVELEILRRQREAAPVQRTVAQTWAILRRYPEAQGLFEWAAWYFALQRLSDETDLLLRNADRQGFSGQWLSGQQALQAVRQGRLERAVGILEAANEAGASWEQAANLGRIFEARNTASRALDAYQKALSIIMEEDDSPQRNSNASQLQFRIARNLKALGRTNESRNALRTALELNPENLSARLELGRM